MGVCSLGLHCVFWAWVPGCQFGSSHLGLWSGIFFSDFAFPDHCLLVHFDVHERY